MPSHLPPPCDPDEPPGPVRRVLARLDPALNHIGSPLRRALHAAGLTGPFDPSTTPDPPAASPDQENPTP